MPESVTRPAPYRLASSLGIVLALAGGFLYYLLREPVPARRSSVVGYLDALVFWPIAFGVATFALLAALIVRRGRSVALIVAAGVFATYATALGYSAVTTGAGWATACLSAGLAMQAVGLSASYPKG